MNITSCSYNYSSLPINMTITSQRSMFTARFSGLFTPCLLLCTYNIVFYYYLTHIKWANKYLENIKTLCWKKMFILLYTVTTPNGKPSMYQEDSQYGLIIIYCVIYPNVLYDFIIGCGAESAIWISRTYFIQN